MTNRRVFNQHVDSVKVFLDQCTFMSVGVGNLRCNGRMKHVWIVWLNTMVIDALPV